MHLSLLSPLGVMHWGVGWAGANIGASNLTACPAVNLPCSTGDSLAALFTAKVWRGGAYCDSLDGRVAVRAMLRSRHVELKLQIPMAVSCIHFILSGFEEMVFRVHAHSCRQSETSYNILTLKEPSGCPRKRRVTSTYNRHDHTDSPYEGVCMQM